MNQTNKKLVSIFLIILIILFLSVETRPYEIVSSTVFSTPSLTEIRLCVIMNTFLPVIQKKLLKITSD